MTSMYTYRGSGEIATQSQIENLKSQMDRTRWLYDEPTGLLTNKVYTDGKGPSYTYTPDGKLATRTWARGVSTTYAYNGSGLLLSVDYSDTTPDVAYTYDRLGRQKVAQTFLSAHHYAYDPATLAMVSETIIDLQAGTSNVISRATDALGRSTGLSVAGVGDPGQPYLVTYGYDAYGRFSSVSTSDDSFTYSYLTGSSLVSGMTASSGHAWTRSYEPQRNLISAVENTYGSTVISRFDYANDEIERRTAISRSGTAFDAPVQDAYGYNARSEVTSARRALADNPNQGIRGFSYDYAYDPIGNRITSKEYDHEDNARMSSYAANALNQYTQRTVPGYACVRGSATNTATVTVNGNTAWRLGEYFYGGDAADNAASAVMKELDITAVVNPPGTNDADIVQSVTGRVFVAKSPETFTHDDDGNLLSDGRFIYTWDGENRLIAVETRADLPASVPRVRVTYQYDPHSRRIGKEVSRRGAEAQSWEVEDARTFLYDGWNLIQELTHTQTHTLTNLYTWGLDMSGSFQGAGGVGGLLAVVQDGETYSPAFDGNGNITEYVSTDGTVAAHYEYTPFGETIVRTGQIADTFAFRFSTHNLERETGHYYCKRRYYNHKTGRWLSRDASGESAGLNLYSYVNGSPVNLVDPDGLRIFFTRSDVITKSGRRTGTITLYNLLRYKAGECCEEIWGAGNVEGKLKETATEHARILEGYINNANYTYNDGSVVWNIRLKMITTTAEAYPSEAHNAARAALRGDQYQQELAKYKVLGHSGVFYGAYDEITVLCTRRDEYDLHHVPGVDPRWNRLSYAEILAHELIGHHLNNADEINQNASDLSRRLGHPIERDAIMTYNTHADTFYDRNFAAGIDDIDNITGEEIVTTDDNTSLLDASDPWFSQFSNEREAQFSLEMIRGLLGL